MHDDCSVPASKVRRRRLGAVCAALGMVTVVAAPALLAPAEAAPQRTAANGSQAGRTASMWSASGAWEQVAPGATSDPVAVSDATHKVVDAFVRTGSSLFHQRQANTTTTEDLGGILSSAPAAVSTAAGTYVFVIGADDGVWYRLVATNGTVTPWATVGGVARRKPAAVVDSDGVVRLFAVGSGDGVWTRRFSGGAWSPWEALGGIVTSDLAAEALELQPSITVVARGTDEAIWAINYRSGVWDPWVSLGGRTVGSPALAEQVAARGVDGQVWLYSGVWRPAGGYLTSDPTMSRVDIGSDRFLVAGRGLDGAAWSSRWGSTNGWFSLAGVVTSTVAVARVDLTGCACVARYYAVGADGALYTIFA